MNPKKLEIDPADANVEISKMVENGDLSLNEMSSGGHVRSEWKPLFNIASNPQKWSKINRLMKAIGAEWKEDNQYWLLIEY